MGVFTSFTLSQSGMVVRWFRLRTPGWRHRAAMNGFGALLTGVVTVVVLVTKFIHGAYIVLIAVAVLVVVFYTVRRHYLEWRASWSPRTRNNWSAWAEWPSPGQGRPWSSSSPRSTN